VCVPCAVCRAPPCRANQRGGNCFGSEAVHPLPCPPCARSRRGTYGLGHLRRRSRRAPSRAPRGWGLGGQARPRPTAGGQKILLGPRTRTGKGRAVGKSQRSNGGVPFRPGRSQRPHARPPARASYSKQQQQAWMRRRCRSGRTVLSRAKRSGGDSLRLTRVPCRCAFARVRCCSGLLLLVLVLGLEGQILHKEQPFAF
jgi:hypothetical protein